jgi:cell division protein FtsL
MEKNKGVVMEKVNKVFKVLMIALAVVVISMVGGISSVALTSYAFNGYEKICIAEKLQSCMTADNNDIEECAEEALEECD